MSIICFSYIGRFFFAIASFNFWMSKGVYDVFALVINFGGNDWQPKHVIIGLFKVIEIISQTLVKSRT
jgi:hypothetical protein